MPRKTKQPRLSSSQGQSKAPSTVSTEPPSTLATEDSGPLFFFGAGNASQGFLSQWFDQHPFTDPNPLKFDQQQETEPASPEKPGEPVVFRTAEHFMMYHKALLFGDAEMAGKVLEAYSPREAKRVGRAVRGFDPDVWDREKMRIVRRGTWCKFTHALADEEEERRDEREIGGGKGEETGALVGLQQRTWHLGTGENGHILKAASFREALLHTGDRELIEASPYDRIWGIGFAAAAAERNRARWGQNLLGKALMEVRDEFRLELEEQEAAGRT